jgi:hypothetical protein
LLLNTTADNEKQFTRNRVQEQALSLIIDSPHTTTTTTIIITLSFQTCSKVLITELGLEMQYDKPVSSKPDSFFIEAYTLCSGCVNLHTMLPAAVT